MDITTFLGIGVIGSMLSICLEFMTAKFDALTSKIITLIMALLVGTVYTLIADSTWFPTVIGILTASSTVYAFFIKK